MRYYESWEEAYKDLKNDIELTLRNIEISGMGGLGLKQTISALLDRVNGDIEYLENKEEMKE